MRILMVSWEYPPFVVGGMGKHVTGLVEALNSFMLDGEPLQIDVLTTRTNGGQPVEQLTPSVTVHRVAAPPLNYSDLYNSAMIGNAILTAYAVGLPYHYDLIHIHDWLVGETGIALKHHWKTPLLATIHATERGRHQGYITNETSAQINNMDWRICYEAWRVIVCSEYMRGEVHYFFGTPYDKVDIIANGLNNSEAASCWPADLERLRRYYSPNGEKLLLFVGRAVYEKGLQVLIRAMPSILATHPDVRLLAAGKNGDQLLPLAQELGIDNAVRFLGYISDAERSCFYQIADAAIFPSLYEPFGIVALEAMVQNCNVIASNVGGLGEVVEHMKNGLTVYPNNPQSIAWAVNELFADPVAARQRRQYALTVTLPQYEWDKIAAQTVEVYQNIVHARAQVIW